MGKICKNCNEDLEYSYYNKSTSHKDGYENICKKCRIEKRPNHTLICQECGEKFNSKTKTTKFCCKECVSNFKHKDKRAVVQCGYCGKDKIIRKSLLKFNQHFCNQKCRTEYLKISMQAEGNPNFNRVDYICDGCGKEIKVIPSKIDVQKYIFCSNECYLKNIGNAVSGRNNYVDDNHRICSVCNEIKDISEFYKDKKSYSRECKKCIYNKNKLRYNYKCATCGESFTSARSNIKYCSQKCASYHKIKRINVVCDFCGEIFSRQPSQFNGKHYKYCSIECKNKGESKYFSGENSHAYNHEKPEEERLIERKYIGYYEWRKAVYDRDNYTCQCCGDDVGGNLAAHHILNYSEHIELRTDIKNGVTMCKDCHKRFHDIYGYKNNNENQLASYFKKYSSKIK